jgi:hypothetical protein
MISQKNLREYHALETARDTLRAQTSAAEKALAAAATDLMTKVEAGETQEPGKWIAATSEHRVFSSPYKKIAESLLGAVKLAARVEAEGYVVKTRLEVAEAVVARRAA